MPLRQGSLQQHPRVPPKGTLVELQGLVANPELNACRGTVITKYDGETGRCGVRLEESSEGVNVKPENLLVITD